MQDLWATLEMTGGARKHTNSLSSLQAGLQGLGGKLENLSADINTGFEIRRSIAKQSVKVVLLVG